MFQRLLLYIFSFSALLLITPKAIASSEQCFYKHDGIRKIAGATHLPDQVCFTKKTVFTKNDLLLLNIQGTPISGDFPLELIIEDSEFSKYMTYIFSKEHYENQTRMDVTLRVSVDVIKDSNSIDYTYLAAEFFVFHEDGSYNTHIYYYKRKP